MDLGYRLCSRDTVPMQDFGGWLTCWNLILMIHLWSHFIRALSHKLIQESYMLKTSQREWLWMCIVIFIRMLNALNTHKLTHYKPYSWLIVLISWLISPIVDLLITIVDLAFALDTYQLSVSVLHTIISRFILFPSRLIIVVVDL